MDDQDRVIFMKELVPTDRRRVLEREDEHGYCNSGQRERADERDRRDLLDLGGAEAVARNRVRPREAHGQRGGEDAEQDDRAECRQSRSVCRGRVTKCSRLRSSNPTTSLTGPFRSTGSSARQRVMGVFPTFP